MTKRRLNAPHLELIEVRGNPSEEELGAIQAALQLVTHKSRHAKTPSLWLRAGRGHGRRLGMYDYRDRFTAADAWRLSVRFPPGGREYPGLLGRGDAR